MAEHKTLEREYTIPLRRAWLRVPNYERTRKAVKTIKVFIARHMKVTDRDHNKIKLDMYFNNDLWFKGRRHPPSRVTVKAKKEGDIVHVTFAHMPEIVKFTKAKHERLHKKADKKVEAKETEATPAKTEEQKKEETEKEQAVAQQNIAQAEAAAKADKHVTKSEEKNHPRRMVLNK